MRAITYFEKTGKIYGVVTFYLLDWHYDGYVFDSFEEAEEWFYDERKNERRQLMSKTAAEKLCGKGYFD